MMKSASASLVFSVSKSAKTTTGVAARVHARCFGALTSKSYAFKARPWELQSVSTYDATDGKAPIQAQLKDAGTRRMLPGGPGFITDRARFSFDGLTAIAPLTCSRKATRKSGRAPRGPTFSCG